MLVGAGVAQKKGGSGGPKKVELPHPFYWAAPDPLRGDWQGEGGYVAQVVPVMDKIYSQEDLIPQQETPASMRPISSSSSTNPTTRRLQVLTGSLNGGTLTLGGRLVGDDCGRPLQGKERRSEASICNTSHASRRPWE